MNDPKGQVYFEPPADFNSKLEVATCYLRSGNELLFLKRLPHKAHGNMWGIPGGKVDPAKDILGEMIREVEEETGLKLQEEAVQEFGTVYIRYPHVDFVYHMFGCHVAGRPEVVLSAEEHVEFAWWSFKEALRHPIILFEDTFTFLVWNDPFFEGCEKPLIHFSSKCLERIF
jgi:8-oxo-dGTP pyrophosphatase MutT (NUDIX family)